MARTKAELEAEIKHLKSQLAQLQTCVAEGSVIGQQFCVLLDSAPILVWTTNRELRLVEVAGGLRDLSMIGTPLADIVSPSASGTDALAAAGSALEGSAAAFRGRVAELEVAGWIAPLYTASARIAGVAGIAIDESARRRAEQDAAQVVERCHTLLEKSDQVLCVHDFHGGITLVQGPVERILGYTAEELPGRTFGELLAVESRAAAAAWVQAISVSFKPRSWQAVALTKAGRKVPIEIHARLVALEGRPPCVEALFCGISAGESSALSGVEPIVRELSSLLSVLSRQPKLEDQDCDRALRLSSELLALATGENRSADVHKIVQQIASSLQRSSRRKVRVVTDLRARNSLVMGDELQIYDLLIRASAKACSAVPRGGELVIASGSAGGTVTISISSAGSPQMAEFRLPSAGETVVATPVAVQRGHGAILVIDEEEVVRRVLSRIIRDLGYDVVSRSTQEALELYRRDHDAFDLVIVPTDSCLRELREIHPSARAVVCGRDGESRTPGVEYLQKPYNLETLDSVLRKALTRTATP